MMHSIFNPDNGLFQSLAKLVDVVGLSLLWLLCSLPIVTLGPATAALYYATVKCVRRDEDKTYGSFFRAFRQNFKVGAPTGLLAAAVFVLLGWGHELLLATALASGGERSAVMPYMAYNVVLLLAVGILCWIFPVLSRFTLGMRGLLGVSVKLAIRHLPATIAAALLTVAAVFLSLRFWLLMLLAPVVVTLLVSLYFERVFKRYTPQAGTPPDGAGEGADTPWYLK